MTLSYSFPLHSDYLQPGDFIQTHCSKCMGVTLHRYEPAGKVKLVCVECETQKENAK